MTDSRALEPRGRLQPGGCCSCPRPCGRRGEASHGHGTGLAALRAERLSEPRLRGARGRSQMPGLCVRCHVAWVSSPGVLRAPPFRLGLAWLLFPPRQQPSRCRELRPWRGRHRGQGRLWGEGTRKGARRWVEAAAQGHNHARIQARHVCTCYHGLRSGGVLLSSGSQPGEVASARGTRCHQNEVGGKQGHVRIRGKPGGVSSPRNRKQSVDAQGSHFND